MNAAADIYTRLCVADEPLPDVFRFLAEQDDLSPRAQLDVLLVDQYQRWSRNETIPIEHYIERLPSLDDSMKVELLVEEFGYLEQRGVAPDPQEFVDRYKPLSEEALSILSGELDIDLPSSTGRGSSTHGKRRGNSKRFVGKSIGRYQVIRAIGKGAFGEVFLANDPDLDRSVAIKIPTRQRVNLGGGVDEFLNEARAVAKLDHPNIVPVFDCGINDDDSCFIVTKYVKGKNLRSEIRKTRSIEDSARIIASLADALHVAHQAGIVHRDVKPGNVILDSNQRPHLLDFGLAMSDQDTRNEKTLIGTPAYMSPEQASGDGHRIDGRSDIYSLGVVFYEMLTGRRPYNSSHTETMFDQLRHGEVKPLRQIDDTIPQELEKICLKALSRQLSARYSTAKDMSADIHSFLKGNNPIVPGSLDSTNSLLSSSKELKLSIDVPTKNSSSPFLKTPAGIIFALCAAVLIAITSWTKFPWSVTQGDIPFSETESTNSASDFSINSIAVMGFRNVSNDPEQDWLGTAFAEMINDELKRSDELHVLSGERISIIKADLELADSVSFGEATLRRIGNRANIKWIMTGAYAPSGADTNDIKLEISIQNAKDNRSVTSFARSAKKEEWLRLISDIGATIRKDLGLSTPDLITDEPILPVAPTKQASVSSYFEGLACLRKLDFQHAREKLELALETDPDSAVAQNALAVVLTQLGEDHLARKHSDLAIQAAKHLPSNHRWEIYGTHHLLEGQPAKAVAVYQELYEQNGELETGLKLISALVSVRQGRLALELVETLRKENSHPSDLARLDLLAASAAQSISEFTQQLAFAKSTEKSAQTIGARLLEGHSLLSAGEAYRRLGSHREAIVCFDRAVDLLQSRGDMHGAARALGEWGKSLVDNGDFDAGEEKAKEALALSTEIGNRRLIARHSGQWGEVQIYRGNYDDAIAKLRNALNSFIEMGDHHGTAEMNLTLANVLARRGKLDEALGMISDARTAFQTAGDRRGEARTWGQKGAVHGRTGANMEARRHFERALELFREVGDRTGEAISLGDLASTYSNAGNLEKAGELYSESLELHRQLSNQRGPGLVMYNLSVLYFRLGRVTDAINLMAKSLENFERTGNQMNALFVRRKFGELQFSNGELDDAKATLESALKQSRILGSKSVEAQCLAGLGTLESFRGEFEEALKLQIESKEIRKQLKQDGNVASNNLALAELAIQQSDWKTASKLLQEAEPTFALSSADYQPMLWSTQAFVAANIGEPDRAVALVSKVEAAFADSKSEDQNLWLATRLEYARALSALGRVDSARSALKQVRGKAERQGFVPIAMRSHLELLKIMKIYEATDFLDRLEEFQQCALSVGFIGLANQANQLETEANSN